MAYGGTVKERREKSRRAAARYAAKNPDKVRESNRFSRARKQLNDPETVRAWRRSYHHRNKVRLANHWKQKRQDRKTEKAAYDREYLAKNREKKKAYLKAWYQANREKQNAYCRSQRRLNPQYRVSNNLRCRMNMALRHVGLKRDYPLEKMLGCTVAHLMRHLESQFKRGMTWKNRKQWHIDHIVPCAAFDLTDKAQQFRCFHFSNLRPMWRDKNIRKGDRIEPCQPELRLVM